jgi:hypothetical protein
MVEVMNCSCVVQSSLLLLTWLIVSAQPTDPRPENTILIDDRHAAPKALCLKDGELRLGGIKVGRSHFFNGYVFGGRDYRMLSASEVRRYDAMPKVEVRYGRLYFGGQKISTNSLWVIRVKAAYHWNGGVALVANTAEGYFSILECENELGFIDLKTNSCRFRASAHKDYRPMVPGVLVPVTINAENRDLALDVAMPDSVSAIDLTSLTNLFPRRAYSTRYIAENTPSGTAISRDSATVITVVSSEGSSETLSGVYSSSKSDGFRWGIPFTRMWIIIKISTAKVKAANSQVRPRSDRSLSFLAFIDLSHPLPVIAAF